MLILLVVVVEIVLLLVSAHGNSATASKLQISRDIKIQGAVKGNAVFDGSKNIIINTTQENVITLTGSISISASDIQGTFNGYGEKTLVYPVGYNKNNTRVISVATSLPAQGIYSTGNIVDKVTASDLQKGMISFYVSRTNEDIIITAYNSMKQALTINYEIVLMKT